MLNVAVVGESGVTTGVPDKVVGVGNFTVYMGRP